MGIQDIIYWVGVVFVWVVLTLYLFSIISESWFKFSIRYSIGQRKSASEIEDAKIASGWFSGIIWSIFSVLYTLFTQVFYHNIWRG